ncbi:MAG: metalloregulator ArsR/SmtB family transcription factor [Acidimicrobiales bacterium]
MRDHISDVFAALSDPTRRDLFEQLLQHPRGCTATELAEGASVSRQAIVKHLQVLARSGLATTKREGREVRSFATTDAAQSASTWLSERSTAWDRRIAALEIGVRRSRDAREGSTRRL